MRFAGKIGEQAKADPCFGVKPSDFNYNVAGSDGKTGLEHITERHITDDNPVYRNRSKYVFSPWLRLQTDPQKRLQTAQQTVIDYNRWTFQQDGRYQASPTSNIVFVYGFPRQSGPGVTVDWFTGEVGKNLPRAGELTNVNTKDTKGDDLSAIERSGNGH